MNEGKGTKNGNKPVSAGFTIIETLLVIAIAGLILLIIFQIIPALTRSSRNNQRRQDVQTILAAVSHWELTNSGNVPQWASGAGDDFLQYSKLTYYTPADVTARANPPASPGLVVYWVNTTTLDTVIVNNHAKCTSGGGFTNSGAGYNDVVALYTIETGSATAPQCQQL